MDERDHPAIPTEDEMELFVATARVIVELPIPEDLKHFLMQASLFTTLLSEERKEAVLKEYQRAAVEAGLVDPDDPDLKNFSMPTRKLH